MATCSCNASRAFYRFPAMARLEERTNQEQLAYIGYELAEAHEAYKTWEATCGIPGSVQRVCGTDAPARRWDYGMELMDVIHAAETALRMEFSDDEARDLRTEVERKNRERGYYDATS